MINKKSNTIQSFRKFLEITAKMDDFYASRASEQNFSDYTQLN